MAALINTIAGRITASVLLLHVVLLPTAVYGLAYLFRQSNEELFLNSARGGAISLADSLERTGTSASDREIVERLDDHMLSGGSVLVELIGDDRVLRSSLVDDEASGAFVEDFGIGQNDDSVYYLALPVNIRGEPMTLHVGYDEAPYHDQNSIALKNSLIAVALYLFALLIILPLIGHRIVRPIRKIQLASRAIAQGSLGEPLVVDTEMREVVELSRDLDRMKNQLIGINDLLKEQISELEASERERRSLEQQLHHSQRLETIGIMAGGFAHELNNMLVPIILYSDLALEDTPEDSPVHKDLERVLGAAKRAKNIVGQVLTFSRKVDEVMYAPIDFGQTVRDAVGFVSASAPATDSIRLTIAPDCPMIMGDVAQLNQLILNICNNALQAVDEQGGRVDVTVERAAPPEELRRRFPSLGDGPHVRLSVRDNGHGMDKVTIARIFEPFFTTRPVGKGTGLGLSMVHGIVTDLDGAIDVRSEPGSGTVFDVYFPALSQAPTASGSAKIHRTTQ